MGVRTPPTSLPYLAEIQRSFGRHDVSGVRAHMGPSASAAAASLGARAYAIGRDTVFAGTASLTTAAHEAAHVVQQRSGLQLADGRGKAGDPWERHADAVADRVIQGESAEALLDQVPGAARGSRSAGSASLQLQPEQDGSGKRGGGAAETITLDAEEPSSLLARFLPAPEPPEEREKREKDEAEIYKEARQEYRKRQNARIEAEQKRREAAEASGDAVALLQHLKDEEQHRQLLAAPSIDYSGTLKAQEEYDQIVREVRARREEREKNRKIGAEILEELLNESPERHEKRRQAGLQQQRAEDEARRKALEEQRQNAARFRTVPFSTSLKGPEGFEGLGYPKSDFFLTKNNKIVPVQAGSYAQQGTVRAHDEQDQRLFLEGKRKQESEHLIARVLVNRTGFSYDAQYPEAPTLMIPREMAVFKTWLDMKQRAEVDSYVRAGRPVPDAVMRESGVEGSIQRMLIAREATRSYHISPEVIEEAAFAQWNAMTPQQRAALSRSRPPEPGTSKIPVDIETMNALHTYVADRMSKLSQARRAALVPPPLPKPHWETGVPADLHGAALAPQPRAPAGAPKATTRKAEAPAEREAEAVSVGVPAAPAASPKPAKPADVAHTRDTKLDPGGASRGDTVADDSKVTELGSRTLTLGLTGLSAEASTVKTQEDGSARSSSRKAGLERGDGRVAASFESGTSKKDASGNEVASAGKFKGGVLAGPEGLGVFAEGERSYTNKRASGFQTGAVAGLDGHIACRVEEVPDTNPTRYRAVVTISLGARAGVTAGRSKDEGGGTANVGVSASGNLVFTSGTGPLGEDEVKAYVAALKSGNGNGREFELIRIGTKEGWDAARRAYLATMQGIPDPSQMKEGESFQIEKSGSIGANASLGAQGAKGASSIGLSGGYEASHSSVIGVAVRDGKHVYTPRESDAEKLSGALSVGIGPVAGGFGASRKTTSALGYEIVLDPSDHEAAAALKACQSQKDLAEFAQKYPKTIKSKTRSTGQADEQNASISIGGVRGGISLGQSLDESVTTDAEGKLLGKTVTGASSGGVEFGVGSLKIGASSVEQAAAHIDASGDASLDVTRADTSTNVGKWLGAHVPFSGDTRDERGLIGKAAGEAVDTDDRDTTGLGLKGNELGSLGHIAVDDFNQWMKACPRPQERDDWAEAGRRIRAAGGNRAVVAEELAKFISKGNRNETIYRLVREPGDTSMGARYEFPDTLVALKPTYDAIVINDSDAALDALAKGGGTEAAIAKGAELVTQLDSIYRQISSRNDFTEFAVKAEMLAAVSTRRDKVKRVMRVLGGGDAEALSRNELIEKYNNLLDNCVRYKQEESDAYDKIQASYADGSPGSAVYDNAIAIKQLRDMYSIWQRDYDAMAGLAQENGFGVDTYWKYKPDLSRFHRSLTGNPGPASAIGPETEDKRRKAPAIQAPKDPVGDANRELEKKRSAQANSIQGRLAPSKNRAFGAGNRLLAWIQTDRKPMAIDAHNRGMKELRAADQDAARLPKNATIDDWEGFGFLAVGGYERAAAAFNEGLALYPPGRPPAA